MELNKIKYMYWILIFSLIVVDVISTGIIKQSVSEINHNYLYGMIGFFISGYILYLLLDMGNLAIINATWDILSIILISIIGIIYFKESYNTYHIIGLIFAFISLFFINHDEILSLFN